MRPSIRFDFDSSGGGPGYEQVACTHVTELPCHACGRMNPTGAAYCAECGGQLEVVSTDEAIGQVVLGRYRLVRVLGEGAMGQVYEGEQSMGASSRRVAVKALHAALGRDAALVERFRRECELVIQLEHPNTIRFLDYGALPDGRAAIVMEYIDGETLAERLRRGPLPADAIDHIVLQIAASLNEAHARGIVHRDLKPDNVMLTERAGERDVVKVCDFGIAKAADGDGSSKLTQQGAVIGTPQYMSPEQFAGGEVDARSDVYSLAVMVYEMMTGTLPFHANTVFQWAERHLSVAPTPIEAHPAGRSVSAPRRAAVMRALAKDPRERPANVLAFVRELTGVDRPPSGFGMAAPAVSRGGLAATAYMHATPVPGGLGSPPGSVHAPESPSSQTAPGHAAPPSYGDEWTAGATEAPRASGGRGFIGLLVGLFALGALAVGGIGAHLALHDGDAESAAADRRPADSGAPVAIVLVDAGPPEEPNFAPPPPPPPPPLEMSPPPAGWLRIVHFERNAEGAASAIGAPDRRYATIGPGGAITLELAPGALVSTDRGPGPDLFVVVDDARSGPYQLAVGTGHDALRVVAPALVGSSPLDIDQYRVRRARYVRVEARTDEPVYLDAVGFYERAEAGRHHH